MIPACDACSTSGTFTHHSPRLGNPALGELGTITSILCRGLQRSGCISTALKVTWRARGGTWIPCGSVGFERTEVFPLPHTGRISPAVAARAQLTCPPRAGWRLGFLGTSPSCLCRLHLYCRLPVWGPLSSLLVLRCSGVLCLGSSRLRTTANRVENQRPSC